MNVTLTQARTHLERLVDRVIQGEEITITRAGRPVARLVPEVSRLAERSPGSAAGRVQVAPDFDTPLPREFTG